MVRGNNILPNAHFHKWWQRHVKTWFNQPARKNRRRLARQEKVAKNGTRPLGALRPAVHPPTQRYNLKIRYGRGFTFEELRAVGISPKVAGSIGIAVDHRRKNRCEETLRTNSARLTEYLNRLVVFPRKNGKARRGVGGIPNDSLMSDVEKTIVSSGVDIKTLMPLPKQNKPDICFRSITDKEKQTSAYETLKLLRHPPKKENEETKKKA